MDRELDAYKRLANKFQIVSKTDKNGSMSKKLEIYHIKLREVVYQLDFIMFMKRQKRLKSPPLKKKRLIMKNY